VSRSVEHYSLDVTYLGWLPREIASRRPVSNLGYSAATRIHQGFTLDNERLKRARRGITSRSNAPHLRIRKLLQTFSSKYCRAFGADVNGCRSWIVVGPEADHDPDLATP